MPITSQQVIDQAIANIGLESLSFSQEVLDLLQKALTDKSITTTSILNMLRG